MSLLEATSGSYLTDTQLFLDLLGGPGARFTFQTFDDSKKRRKARAEAAKSAREAALAAGKSKEQAQAAAQEAGKDPFARIFHGTFDEHRRDLRTLNEVQAGVFVTINETDLKGRKAANVVGVRAIFAELDGPPLDKALAKLKAIGLEPHIVVMSSPDKWHLYMLTTGIALDQFATLQKRLIRLLGSDASVHDLPRVMRLPGFFHQKYALFGSVMESSFDLAEVFPGVPIEKIEMTVTTSPPGESGASVVCLDEVYDHAPYGPEAFDGLPPADPEPKPKDDHHGPRPDDHDIALDCLAHINNDGRFIVRADWLAIGMAVHSGTGGSFAGRMAWTAWTARRHDNADEECREAWDSFDPDSITIATLIKFARDDGFDPYAKRAGATKGSKGGGAPPPCTLAEAHTVFRRWLGQDFDLGTLDAVLAVAASERLPGDPVWLLVISGSGNTKTETVQSTSRLGAHIVSTITSDAALLSASPKRQRSKTATGGLLRAIGERGLVVIKDVTSILSVDRNMRATILAALREIHDGRWVRNVGTDGGQTLSWQGRIVIIGACTTAWDQAHAVIATMGDRFVLIRSSSHVGRDASGRRAIRNIGDEAVMRQELAKAVAGVVDGMSTTVYPLSEDDETAIVQAADIVSLVRTGVEIDYRGDVIDAHAPEMPTRLGKQLAQIMRGAIAIGMTHDDALKLVLRCARDCMPPLRLAVLLDVAGNPGTRVMDVRRRLQKPRTTIDRTLQALHILGLLTCMETEAERDRRTVQIRQYTVYSDYNKAVYRIAMP